MSVTDNHSMFPTHVGMNRSHQSGSTGGMDVPHTRGDEPSSPTNRGQCFGMFPTHVGMNRCKYQQFPL